MSRPTMGSMNGYLTEGDVVRMTKVGRSTLRRWEKAGLFPARIRIGHRTLRWRESEVRAWMASHEKPDAQAERELEKELGEEAQA